MLVTDIRIRKPYSSTEVKPLSPDTPNLLTDYYPHTIFQSPKRKYKTSFYTRVTNADMKARRAPSAIWTLATPAVACGALGSVFCGGSPH